MATFREASREEARRMHRLNAEADQVSRYIGALTGNHWNGRGSPWRSKFVDNRIAKARIDHLAQLTDTRPIIDVSSSVEAYQDTAKVIKAMIQANWTRHDVDLKLVTAADIADTYGTGFWRIGAARPGPPVILPCGPDQVMPIQPGFDIQESSAVLFRTWKAVQWLKRKFPYSTANIEREILNQPTYGTSGNQEMTFNRPQHIDEFTWNGLAQGMKRVLGVKGAPTQEAAFGRYYKSIEVEELFVDDGSANESPNTVTVSDPFMTMEQHNWWYTVAPGAPLFPRKRHMVFAGSRLLSDGPSPYWHGLYPFATLRFNPVFWSFWGLSRYRDLVPINQAMNEIVSACLDLIKRALNPTALTKEGAISPTQWREFFPDLPGTKLRVGPNQNLQDAMKYMDPPVIPSYVVQMLQGWLAPEFDRMAGSIDIGTINQKNQLPSGDSIDVMRDSQNTGLRMEERMLEIFLRDAGKQVVSNELQFSTAEHRLMVLGEAGLTRADFNMGLGDMLPEDKAAQPDFWKQFGLTISAGSLHSGSKDRTKQVAMQLAAGGEFPLLELYKVLEYPDPQGVYDRLIEEAQQRGGIAAQAKAKK